MTTARLQTDNFTAKVTLYNTYGRVRRLGFGIKEVKRRIETGNYTAQEWMKWMADIHNVLYSFYELEGVVLRWARLAMTVVSPAIPEELKTGVHFTGRHTAACGEKIWIVDGEICHDMWLYHTCNSENKSTVSRTTPEQITGHTLYCTGCKAYFSAKDTDMACELD